jgi:lysine-specific demethylase/histidyl-hydroxylase NO66
VSSLEIALISFFFIIFQVVTAAVRVAIEENVEFRKGLPHGYLNFMGVAHSDESSTQRTDFIEKVKSLMAKLSDHAPIDAAVDQMGKQFIHDALPPVLTAGKYHCHSERERERERVENFK